jgi:hypothetical protein
MSTSSAVATSLAAGDVLASAPAPAAENGLLVKILSVSINGQVVSASVQQATLQDAIQQASFQFTETLGPTNTATSIRNRAKILVRRPHTSGLVRRESSSSGACTGNANTIQLPFDVPLAEEGVASLTLTGEEDFCPSFTLAIQISGFQLVSMNATVTVGVQTSLGLLDSVEESFNLTQDLQPIEGSPTVVLIGNVPVVVQPILTPFVGVTGEAEANVYTGITTSSTLTLGVSYANGPNGQWEPVDSSVSPAAVASSTSVDGQLSIKAFAGLQAGVLLDGFLTPNLSGDGYLQFSSSLTGNPCWSLDAGLEANVGVDVSFLGESLEDWSSQALNLYSVPLLQATNTCFAPVLSSVQPSTALLESPQLTLALSGSNFVPDSTANFNGKPLATTFEDPNDLTAVVPARDLAVAGSFPVTATSPDNPGGTSSSVGFTVSNVTVSLSPTTVSVPVGTAEQFVTTVQGSSNTAVTWSVNGVTGGNSTIGTITQQGDYTAPLTVPNPSAVTVTATSQANSSVSVSASVTVITFSYTYVTIDYPNYAGMTGAFGINNAGDIVGGYGCFNCEKYGFLDASGNFSSINDPSVLGGFGASYTLAYGINNSNQIVGGYSGTNAVVGFLYLAGNYTDVNYPNSQGTVAYGINDSAQIVGQYEDQAGNYHGFIDSGGTFSSIDFPNATSTLASGINFSGEIVGSYVDQAGNQHGFVDSGGTFSSFDFPNATSTVLYGINSGGLIAGSYSDQAGNTHGFVDSGDTFTSIDYPGTEEGTSASGINDSGQIVGAYPSLSGQVNQNDGFLATPTQ